MTFHIFHHDEENPAHVDCVRMNRATPAANIIAFGQESLRLLTIRESGHDDTHWHEAKHVDDITVYRGIVNDSVWNCIKTLNDASAITKFEEMTEYCHVIANVDVATSIRHVKAKAVFPTTARDFVVVTSESRSDKAIVIATRSILHDDMPEDPHFVRATMLISGYVIRPTGKHQCQVTMVAHVDLGGHFPAFVINLLAVDAPIGSMKRLRELYNHQEAKLAATHA
ncbi:unnamed protein product [Aphanomyces euteiches]|uniref:START domain-containing protein n=1 Tax=Aphanomyces euteiches TaxID=100861 RepID=A0A6G0WE54_9STRA|nr:hypothetical protein Ae201684_016689 [Aphanomyces euteiches]KAH9083005.1 hypothetical protein Ae201684P_013908 [Aphanomyces euteiches]KAH9147913.1 hypothetical protein AeRB84_008570 [Aphanomyces euteiches]